MLPGDYEPNHKYRPWLEKYIGAQHKCWDWDLMHNNYENLKICFVDSDSLLLFSLRWQ